MGRTRAERVFSAFTKGIWALHPPKIEEIAEILIAKLETGQIPEPSAVAELEAAQRKSAKSSGSVAVVPLMGTLSKRLSGLDAMSGGASIEAFVENFRTALADPDVGSILIQVHSPGGSVYGIEEAFRVVHSARGQKRIVSIFDSLSASAAYYTAVGAGEVVATPSAEGGSIGVYTMHVDFSEALAADGIKVTIIKAGENKAEGNPYEPLSEEALAHTQSVVDAYYSDFLRAVARGRGVPIAKVRQEFGKGRTFEARRMVQLGMADRIATFEETVEDLIRGRGMPGAKAAQVVVPSGLAAMEERGRIVAGDVHIHVPEGLSGADVLEAIRKTAGRAAPEPRMLDGLTESEMTAARIEAIAGPQLHRIAEALLSDLEGEVGADSDPTIESNPEAAVGQAAPVTSPAPPIEQAPVAEESTVEKSTGAPSSGASENGATATVHVDPAAEQRKREQEIRARCSAHNIAERADGYIAASLSVDQVNRIILDEQERSRPGSTLPKADPPVTLTERENKKYSIARLIMAEANGDPNAAGFEREIDRELRSKLNYAPKGILVPTTLGLEPKGQLTTSTPGGGEELVFIEPGSFIELLRSRLVTAAMGATFLPGLRGNVDFPKQTGAGAFSWEDEAPANDSPADTDLDTGTVQLRPKNGRSITSFSRTLLAQAVVNVEQLVRRDLAAITARGIDLAALHGTGANNQPTGIYVANGVNPVAFDGVVSYPKVVEMETVIAEADADIDRMGYVSTPGVRGAAKTTLTFPAANTGMPIWTGGVRDGEMNGYRAMASTQVSKTLGAGAEHGKIFGAWQHLLIGEWGAMDILVDPYTRGGRGLIRVIAFAIADVALRYPEAFSKATGLTVATDES